MNKVVFLRELGLILAVSIAIYYLIIFKGYSENIGMAFLLCSFCIAFSQRWKAHTSEHALSGKCIHSVDGYPADCVLAGLYHIMPERPDVILSGVNRGNNSAENVLYSGTIGAALEGALQGIKSFALSQYLGPKNYDAADPFEASHVHGTNILRDLIAREYDNPSDYHIFYNINFPPVPAADVKGHKFAAQGRRQGSQFSAIMKTAPNNREFLYVKGGDQHVAVGDTSDAGVNLDGYISITPMRADLTAYDILEKS